MIAGEGIDDAGERRIDLVEGRWQPKGEVALLGIDGQVRILEAA